MHRPFIELNSFDIFIAISFLLFLSIPREHVFWPVRASPIDETSDNNCDQAQTHCATRDTLFNLDNLSNASTSASCKSGTEFSCVSRLQCIPLEFVCDRQYDCQDQSDEIGCSAPSVISEPPKTLYGLEHGAINISCEASGLPKPSIHWTHNGFNLTGNEAEIISSSTTQIGTSGVLISDVYGSQGPLLYYVMSTIQFVNLNQQDAGYWACHASNNQGNTSSSIETLLTIRQKAQICQQQPYFNDLASSEDECLKCYCSGVSDTCFSSSYYLSKLHVVTRPRVVNILTTVSVLHNNNDYRHNNNTNSVNKMIGEQKRYRSYEEAESMQGDSVLPDYHSGLSQYKNQDRQAMLNNIHNGVFYYYKIEPNDIEESKAIFSKSNNSNNTDSSNQQYKQQSSNAKSAGLSLIRSYGGYMRFSFTFNILNQAGTFATSLNDTGSPVPINNSDNNIDNSNDNSNSRKETDQSVLQDLADVLLLCGNGDVIYHHYDIYSTSIVANQNNHFSVPLTESYWLMAINKPSNTTTRYRQQDPTTANNANKRSGTAPYNFNVNHQLQSTINPQDNAFLTITSSGSGSISPKGHHHIRARRSDYYNDLVFARHGFHHLSPSRDKFMFCLSDVRAIYIRAIYDLKQITFNISSIYIDTAVGGATAWNSTMGSDLQASLVEQCVCPTGHEGSSCELCSNSFERYLTTTSSTTTSTSAPPRVLCKLKVRGNGNRSSTGIGSLPAPHYSHYYNQSASILPVLSINDNSSNNNNTATSSPELSEATPTTNSDCVSTGNNNEQCRAANNCANDYQSPYCDIPTANNKSGGGANISSYVVAIEEPKNLTVALGAFVRFTCTIKQHLSTTGDNNTLNNNSDTNNDNNVTLAWSRLFRPSPQYTSSSTVVKQLPNGIELQLHNITYEDIGLYMCELGQNVSDIKMNSSSEMKDPRRDFAHLSVEGPNDSKSMIDSTEDDSPDYDAEGNTQTGNTTSVPKDSVSTSLFQEDSQDNSFYNSIDQFFLANPSHEQTIRIMPNYSETTIGSPLQLTCLSDSDQPDLQQVEWLHVTEDQVYLSSNAQGNYSQSETIARQTGVTILQNVLMINSVIDKHAGIYTCKATNRFNITAEALARVVIVTSEETPPQVYIEPERVTGQLNQYLELRCFASGQPGPRLSWIKVGQNSNSSNKHTNSSQQTVLRLFETEQIAASEIHLYTEQLLFKADATFSSISSKKSNRRAITSMSILKIDGLTVLHSGQYICRANNNKGSNQASAVVEVDYEMQPTIKVTPLEQTVRLDSQHEAKIGCYVLEGRPKPKISWFKLSTNGNYRVTNSKRGLETMLRTVHHRAPEATSSQHFVNLIPTLVDLSSVATAANSVSGSNSIDIQDSLQNGQQMSILSLKRVTTNDDGTYICMADNKLGRHSVVASLQVIVPATVKIMQSSVMNANEDDSFQLECLANGHPLPINLEWTKRNNRLPYFSLVSKQQQQQQQEEEERAVLRFDRIDTKDSGEYICQAKNSLDNSAIYDSVLINVIPRLSSSLQQQQNVSSLTETDPKLLRPQMFTRPVKILSMAGSNVTIDCLAMSGRQPIQIEWITSPVAAMQSQQQANDNKVTNSSKTTKQQVGSKLKLYNISQQDEGTYQCFGYNKYGRDMVTAEMHVIVGSQTTNNNASNQLNVTTDLGRQSIANKSSSSNYFPTTDNNKQTSDTLLTQSKTMVAFVGSNIELTCRVEGVVNPAISWSREGEQLPRLSIQIGHNLWIQSVNKNDTGRYICSARSSSPNKIIQDNVTLLVRESISISDTFAGQSEFNKAIVQQLSSHRWLVSIVPSKSSVKLGDSITLECLIKLQNSNNSTSVSLELDLDSLIDADGTIKREISAGLSPVTWTNSNTGQSWFQDNVYIQDNLLIIYDLRPENTAIYRCTHNDLNEHDEFALTIVEDDRQDQRQHKVSKNDSTNYYHQQQATIQTTGSSFSTTTATTGDYADDDGSGERAKELQKLRRSLIRRVPIESRVVLECPFDTNRAMLGDIEDNYANILHNTNNNKFVHLDYHRDVLHYWWTKWGTGSRLATNQPYTINSVSALDSSVYVCQGLLRSQQNGSGELQQQTNKVKATRFYFLPTVLSVDRLIARFVQNPVSFIAYPTITGAYFQLKIEIRFLPERDSGLILYNGQYKPSGDFISLGLNRGHVEFRFELGDGLTLLRSVAPVALNKWHNVLIERDRRKATLLVDQQPLVSNSSNGKFHNLDLDSLLYIGGHQHYYGRYQANNLANSRQLNRRLAINNNTTIADTTARTLAASNDRIINKERAERSAISGDNQQSATKQWSRATTTTTTAMATTTKFYGFSQGFHGCISHLRVSNQDINLTTKDRTVSIGIYECQHNQCHGSKCDPNNSVCQHEDLVSLSLASSDSSDQATIDNKTVTTAHGLDTRLRCICLPGYLGRYCNESLANQAQQQQEYNVCQQQVSGAQRAQRACNQPFGRCIGGQRGQLFASASQQDSSQHHCECKLGFTGARCEERIVSGSQQHQQAQLKRSTELSFDSTVSSWLAIRQTRISNAMFKVKIQLKFRPNARALLGKDAIILYSGQSSSGLGDHIMLSLRQDGHVEFNLDTGSGVTSIRSQNAIVVHEKNYNNNQWISVMIERSPNELIMRIDDQPEIVRQLTTDSSGNQQSQQHFSQTHNSSRSVLNIGLPFYVGDIDRNRKVRLPSYAQFFKPFDGCLSQLVINDYEYDFSTLFLDSSMFADALEDVHYDVAFSSLPNWFLDSSNIRLCNRDDNYYSDHQQSTQNNAKDTSSPTTANAYSNVMQTVTNINKATGESTSQEQPDIINSTMASTNITPTTMVANNINKNQICDILSPCATGATCYPIGTALYKCHCPIGLMGDTCSMQAVFTPETTVQFNQNAYISLRFANLDEIARQQQQQQQQQTANNSSVIIPKLQSEDNSGSAQGNTTKGNLFKIPLLNASSGGYNLTLLAKQLSMTEQQTISFTLVTTSNYGIIFYLGQVFEQQTTLQQQQASASAKAALTSDYIAIALVDGYIELSYELGSGVALIRSATKVNDDNYHKIIVTRNGRFAMLTIDGTYIQEGVSPGKLSMLNALGDIYLGGLPNASQITNNRYMTGFQGCLLDFELNRHGPVNLIRSDMPVQITSGRNVSPCMRKSKIHGSASNTASDDGEESDS